MSCWICEIQISDQNVEHSKFPPRIKTSRHKIEQATRNGMLSLGSKSPVPRARVKESTANDLLAVLVHSSMHKRQQANTTDSLDCERSKSPASKGWPSINLRLFAMLDQRTKWAKKQNANYLLLWDPKSSSVHKGLKSPQQQHTLDFFDSLKEVHKRGQTTNSRSTEIRNFLCQLVHTTTYI